MRLRILVIAAAAGALLSGCVSISRVPAGPAKVGATEVTLGRDWADVSVLMPGRTKKVRLLSLDGPLLNRLYISDGLAPGDYLVKPQAKEQPTPVVRADMSVTERIEFVADSISAMGFQRVQAGKPRPSTLGGHSGVRFDLTAKTSDGLDVAGSALAAEAAGKTYVVIYLAPAEHYYAANLAEVENIITSAKVR